MRHRIHVPLLSDPAKYVEADARAAGNGRFVLVSGENPASPLQYRSGEIVECTIQELPNGSRGLVATHSVSADPEYRSRRMTFAVSGATVGAVTGVVIAFSADKSPTVAAILAAVLALIFAFCSVRWGDAFWDLLVRIAD